MKTFRPPVNWPALQRAVRHWVWALTGAMAGALALLWWDADVFEQRSQLQQQVQSLRSAARPASAAVPERLVGLDLIDRLPAVSSASRLGLQLQTGLATQGLQVQTLRPQALQTGLPLPSQALALGWQARFEDFSLAWSSLVDAGPVWTLDRLTVVPAASAGQLQWDGVWRAWLRPDAAADQAWPAAWVRSHSRGARSGQDLFVPPGSALAGPAVGASEPGLAALPADPRQWPLAAVRLVGVWQQADSLQAVLSAGPHWVALGVGGQLAQEGYRVKAIHPESVELQALRGGGLLQVLRLERGGS